LNYYELDQIAIKQQCKRKCTMEEIDELLKNDIKNDIIKQAYLQWSTITFCVDDEINGISTVTRLETNEHERIDVPNWEAIDVSQETNWKYNFYLYPDTILAFKRKKNWIEQVTKNWVCSDITIDDKNFLDRYEKILKEKWAIELPSIYPPYPHGINHMENLLI